MHITTENNKNRNKRQKHVIFYIDYSNEKGLYTFSLIKLYTQISKVLFYLDHRSIKLYKMYISYTIF